MRQRRWIELFSDYDCEIIYHPGKANVVWICQISQENSQKRTRERMSDQEAKEIKAEEIMPQPEITAGSARHRNKESQRPKIKSKGQECQVLKV
ncbi:hypothetical protein Tco_0871050 [Tanacetum coccineum]